MLIARQGDAIDITQHFQWRNGRDIFDVSTSQLRHLLFRGKPQQHPSVLKWTEQLQFDLNFRETCKAIWQPYLSVKEACFAWQILY